MMGAYDIKNDLESKIVRHSAPTLAGLKPSNLFIFPSDTKEASRQAVSGNSEAKDLYSQDDREEQSDRKFITQLDFVQDKLSACKVGIEIIARRKTGFLLLVFRPDMLKSYLQRKEIAAYLISEGYDISCLSSCLARLKKRVRTTDLNSTTKRCDFPHEIGLFLGYPFEDVMGFIENKGEKYLSCGCWKVYTKQRDAEECFCSYKRCTETYQKMYETGTPIERLAAIPRESVEESFVRIAG